MTKDKAYNFLYTIVFVTGLIAVNYMIPQTFAAKHHSMSVVTTYIS